MNKHHQQLRTTQYGIETFNHWLGVLDVFQAFSSFKQICMCSAVLVKHYSRWKSSLNVFGTYLYTTAIRDMAFSALSMLLDAADNTRQEIYYTAYRQCLLAGLPDGNCTLIMKRVTIPWNYLFVYTHSASNEPIKDRELSLNFHAFHNFFRLNTRIHYVHLF